MAPLNAVLTTWILLASVSLASPADALSETPLTAEELAGAADSFLETTFAKGLTPALGVAIIRDGKTIYLRNRGVISIDSGTMTEEDSYWYIASTSKAFAGMAVSLMAARGELRFEAPIAELLPGASWAPGVDPRQLTLADFLGHRSGLDGGGIVVSTAFTGEIAEADLPGWLHLQQPIGSRDLRYSNLGYEVAGLVISRFHPAGWRAFEAKELFAPAGMHDTLSSFDGVDRSRIVKPHELTGTGKFRAEPFQKSNKSMGAAGGHISTLSDLARWTIVMCDEGMLDGRQVFPKKAVDLSQTVLATKTNRRSIPFAMFMRPSWGAGWDIGTYKGKRMISRFGSYGGLRSHLSFLPDQRVGVVAQSSGGAIGSALTDIVAAYVYDLDSGRGDALSTAQSRVRDLEQRADAVKKRVADDEALQATRNAQKLARPHDDLVGEYGAPGFGVIRFIDDDGQLRFRWGEISGEIDILDAETLRMEIPVGGELQFLFNETGPATGVRMRGTLFTRGKP